ncbi:hypothetical protein PIB30_056879 [Stylosanthes scabra]|uniref:Uncharacterized protein n=1 Tax=Stylosanthes scabra TaxID=79078 RepID=A0ABU6VLI5_9FABA|nr:hypothetical protein [Stylosanthes scabra]
MNYCCIFTKSAHHTGEMSWQLLHPSQPHGGGIPNSLVNHGVGLDSVSIDQITLFLEKGASVESKWLVLVG